MVECSSFNFYFLSEKTFVGMKSGRPILLKRQGVVAPAEPCVHTRVT